MANRADMESVAARAKAPGAVVHVGLIGHGIEQSRTPKMHVEEGRALGLSYTYDLIDVARRDDSPGIDALLSEVEQKGYDGVNITHPFKQAAIPHLDALSEAARAVGAVNTVVFRDGKRFGHNTDFWGFSAAFAREMADVATGRVLLLGAGGAGGAVAHALIERGAGQLAVFDPDLQAAKSLVDRLTANVGRNRVSIARDIDLEIESADGLVNASPVGMASLPGSPVPAQLLSRRHWVADIIYFPLETQFLAAARAAGCRTMNGSGMAVFQALRAFELFTGRKPDQNRMRATFEAFTEPDAA